MSNRSKRKHRQLMGEHLVPWRKPAAAPARSAQGGTKRRAIWFAAAVVVVAAVVYAVSGGGGRKGEFATASVTNLASFITPLTLSPLLSATTGVASVAGSSGPKIVFATPVYDFGQIKGGEAVKYTFVFTNAGDRLLEVSGVQPSCGCTTAGEWTRQVEPGKTGTLSFTYSLAPQVANQISSGTYQLTAQKQIGTIATPLTLQLDFGKTVISANPPEERKYFGDNKYDLRTDLNMDRAFIVNVK